jgi:diguanylate cyclase (GGDEF)-like protein/PAS domain S-box-containing protein
MPDLLEAEQRYLGLLEISGEALVIVCETKIVFANKAAGEILGVEAPKQLLGLPCLDFVSPKYRRAVAERAGVLTTLDQTAPFAYCRLMLADGKIADVEIALHACRFHGEPAIQALMRDVSERRRLQAEVAYLAQYDALTELVNRRQYRDRLDGAIARAKRNNESLGVACIGIDRFKAVNDRLGQRGGDDVLMHVAERLKNIVRKGDTVARTGGDEFSVVLEGMAEGDGARVAAERCRASLERPFTLEGGDIALTASIGIAVFPDDASDVESLLRKAALAMHYAKQRGRNQCRRYTADLDEMDRSAVQRRAEIAQRRKNLTPREQQVLELLIAGKASKMIAYLLEISTRTVDVHRARVMEKMHADSLPELVHMTRELCS